MQKSLFIATMIAALSVATCAVAASTSEPIQSSQPEATPDGCIPGNGGSAPICTPSTGPGGK